MMEPTPEKILSKAKEIAPWFWPSNPWSVDLSCAQGQQRTLYEAKRLLQGKSADEEID